MAENQSPDLTASEIGILWGYYIKNSLIICMTTAFLEKVEDPDIHEVLLTAKKHSQDNSALIEEVCQREQMVMPKGFIPSEDVNPSAPRLFSDAFMLDYARHIAIAVITSAGAGISVVTRSDMTNICQTTLQRATELHEAAKERLLTKGIYSRPPAIPVPKEVDFVDKQTFLRGFLGERRALTAVEITHLFENVETNTLGKALMMGFAQVAKDPKVKKYFVRGKEIAHKHIEVFGSLLKEEDLPPPMGWETNVTDTTVSPFSDKLMTFHTTALIDIGIGNYGLSTAGSPRRDIGLTYARLMGEIALMAEDGANLMIDKSWLEQPPPAPDRDALASEKGDRG
ncbi:DUF3231 family protein [Natribacillus halophilus]|uniref:DUF3231 family protein n=1 Tax=Natribacillus halophilus TaxID=549003 RepID=UPI0015A2950E|nr:DUF3231 family protein [Natribacillus halophilus]